MDIKNLREVFQRMNEIQERFLMQPKLLKKENSLNQQSIVQNELRNQNEFINKLIEEISNEEGVNSSLIKAIATIESNYNPDSISRKGAIGVMQLMPETARDLKINPYNVEENIRGGIQYLKKLAERFKNLDLTLAAYNAGPANVEKYSDIPPFKETQNYIKKIKKILNDLQD